MGEMPRNSPAMAMVLAVNWPPQAPGPGQAEASSASSSASLIFAGGVRAHAFEDLKDGNFFGGAVGLLERAGGDAAAVEHEAGDVEAGEGHDGGGHVLVAAGDADDAVETVSPRHELDGVGDDFAGDQRGFHALGSHGDAVVDRDGVELHRRATGLANALLDGLGDLSQMEVAGADLGPCVGDADDRLVQVFLAEADAAKVRAGCGAGRAFGEGDGIFLRIDFVGQFVSLFHEVIAEYFACSFVDPHIYSASTPDAGW